MGRLRRDLAERKLALAKRKLASHGLRSHMVDISSADGAAYKTVCDVHCEMIGRMGVSFWPAEKRHMYIFVHKALRRLVKKRFKRFFPKKIRKRLRPEKRKVVIKFTNDVDAGCQWRERLAIWGEDDNMLKYCMIGFAD